MKAVRPAEAAATRTVEVTEGRHSRLLGVGTYRPRRVVTNEEVCRRIESTDEWIRARSGIQERRFAAPDETLLRMSATAGERALADAGIAAGDLDLVLLASMSNLVQTPPLAVRVAYDLGAHAAAAVDLSAACAGFCHALAMASDAVRAGSAHRVLVIGAERMTDIVEPEDRTVAFLFADGAGAVVVGAADSPGIGAVARRADGALQQALRMTAGWADGPDRPWMRMDGRRVFRWAMDEVVPAALLAVERAGLSLAELDAFVPHQANLRMIEMMSQRLGLDPRTVVAQDVVNHGNTSAASIPLAIETLRDEGRVTAGATALLVGFGAGLTFAAQTVVLP